LHKAPFLLGAQSRILLRQAARLRCLGFHFMLASRKSVGELGVRLKNYIDLHTNQYELKKMSILCGGNTN